MKKITAIVRQEKLEVLKDALFAADVRGMTINQVQGCGAQHGWKEYVRGNELLVNTIPKVQFTLICADEHVDGIVEIICNAARTGAVGDGKIWVEEVIRIRTGEHGPPRCRIDRLPSATLKYCNEAQDLRCGWTDYGA